MVQLSLQTVETYSSQVTGMEHEYIYTYLYLYIFEQTNWTACINITELASFFSSGLK